jgi:type II secretory pathway predicted ATPase ExeA
MKSMYYLGLVFYVLFSSGESPPADLFTLPSLDGAFVSLSTLSLVKQKDNEEIEVESKRHQDVSNIGQDVGICKINSEYLNFIGVPSPVCDMICNMLECVYGGMSGDDSYSSMVDLISDLQLMVNKPYFVQGLDMNSVPSTGLSLEKFVIPRSNETDTILSSYRRCAAGSCEVVIIQGDSGIGKSVLLQKSLRAIAIEGGFCFIGKFDQMKQALPFASLSSAFEQYCDVLIQQKESDWAKDVVSKLRDRLGQDTFNLCLVIPKLKNVLGSTCTSADHAAFSGMDCRNMVQRLQHQICQLVEVVSSSSMPVVLAMDDVQWADAASMSVLRSLLRHENKNFLFVGCCRDGEMASDHSFWNMTKEASAAGICLTTVELTAVSKSMP